MDGDIGEAAIGSPLDQSTEVVHMAVDTAIGAEAQQVQGPSPLLDPFHQRLQHRSRTQLIAAHGVADPHQLLADDATRTDG